MGDIGKHRKPRDKRRVQMGGMWLDRDVYEYMKKVSVERNISASSWMRDSLRIVMEAELEEAQEQAHGG
jgi:hypothetical protein